MVSKTESDPMHSPLYGEDVINGLALLTLNEALTPHLDAIVDEFYGRLTGLPGARPLIRCLATGELNHLKRTQKDNLLLLCSPALTEQQHEQSARRVGHIHALIGLSQATLADSHEILQAIVLNHVEISQRHAHALGILYRRLLKELAWQLYAMQALHQCYQHILQRINALSWTSRNYIDFIQQAADLLAQSDGIAGCAFVRPDEDRLLVVEALAGGQVIGDLCERIEAQQQTWASQGEDPLKSGSLSRAWASQRIERCLNYVTDETAASWTPFMQSVGIRSSITVPLTSQASNTTLLVLCVRFPGALSSPEQDAFVMQVQSSLIFGINRLSAWSALTTTVPYGVRRHWYALLAGDGLEMHYQPIMDLATGQTVKVEALARLRDGEQLLAPGQFFPALSSEDFFLLYVKGLNQVLKQRAAWQAQGIVLDVALNLPVAGLTDARYLEATASALQAHGCPPAALTLEVLETEETTSSTRSAEVLNNYLKLGVTLSEDDLGSGYSSLSRLRQIPFQVVKIDRSIIGRADAGHDSFDALRFVYQITRLGHNLGKKVLVEGVEDKDMLEAIALLGTDYAQGYVIAKPMPARDLSRWLACPGATGPLRPRDMVAVTPWNKLARLLIWEEELHLLLGDTYSLPTDDARLRDMRSFIMEMPVAAFGATAAKNELMSHALSPGLHSLAYAQAREDLITMILNDKQGA